MAVEHESEVGRHGVQTSGGPETARGHAGDVRNNVVGVYRLRFAVGHVATNRVRSRYRIELFGCDLDAAPRAVDGGKTVDSLHPAGQLPDEDRAALDGELLGGPGDVEPEQCLPIDREVPGDGPVHQLGQPGPDGDDEVLRRVSASVSGDACAVRRGFESDRPFVAVNRGSVALRLTQMGGDAALGAHEAGVLLEIAALALRHQKLRKPVPDLRGIEKLVSNAESPRSGNRVLEKMLDVGPRSRGGTGNDEPAVRGQQILARLGFQLAP